MRPDIFLATIGRGSNGSNALEVTEDRAAVTAESQDNIINRVNNVSQYGPSWHYVPGIGVAGTAYAEVPGTALGDLAFSRASSKTRTNAAGVVETIASNVLPHDYRNADGTLSTFPRLNLEPQRTNSIRNSSMVGAVAGSPGTLPTNWAVVTAGLTQTISVGTENGLPYVDLRFNGTASSSIVRINSETINQIAATNGQAWASSTYMRRISGTYDSSTLGFAMRSSAGAGLGALTAATSLTTTLQRFVFVGTTNNASVAFVQPQIDFLLTSGAAYDFTIRIAAPQMELGNFASTWVPTTTAAVTRIADTASKTGVSSLIGQTEGTLFVELTVPELINAGGEFSISNGTDIVNIQRPTSANNRIRSVVFIGGAFPVTIDRTITTGGTYKVAFAYKQNDFVVYVNGILVGTDTSGNVPTMDRLYFTAPFQPAQAALFPTRLTNAQLAQLTTL